MWMAVGLHIAIAIALDNTRAQAGQWGRQLRPAQALEVRSIAAPPVQVSATEGLAAMESLPQEQTPPQPRPEEPATPSEPPPAPALTQEQLAEMQAQVAALYRKTDVEYLPRYKVDQPPVIHEQLELPWPKGEREDQRHVARFRLYIDETGVVRRITGESADLPAAFHYVVRDSFMAARFEPGVLAGQPVKTWIRIEVEFGVTGIVMSRILLE